MSLTRPVSCASDKFSLYCFSFLLINWNCYLSTNLFFDDESDNDGSGSRSPGTCTFSFCSGKSVGRVSGLGSGVFVPTGIESIGDVVLLVLFVPRGVKSKSG